MSASVPMNSARRTKSYAAAELADADGIKTSFATSTDPVTLAPEDFDGAAIGDGGVLDLPRTVTVTRSDSANQFSTEPIVITGRRGHAVVVVELTPDDDDGNDVLRDDHAFDSIVSIEIPAQGGTGGTFTIGVQDICAPYGDRFTGVRLHESGNLNVRFGEAANSPTDTIPAGAALEPVAPTRILTNPTLSAPTIVGLTVYMG